MNQTKLRSFVVSSIDKYNKFAEIQRNKQKKIGQRLNELMELEVKEADPAFIDKSAARTPEMHPLDKPNPFVYTQDKSLPEWEKYLRTLTRKEHEEILNHVFALYNITKTFDSCVDQ